MHPRHYLFYKLPDGEVLIRGLDLEEDRLTLRTFEADETELSGSEEMLIPDGMRGVEYLRLWIDHHVEDGWVESRKDLSLFPVADANDPTSLLRVVQFGYPRMGRPKKTPNRVIRVPSSAKWVTFLWNPLTEKLHTTAPLEGDKSRLSLLSSDLKYEFSHLETTIFRGWWFEGTLYILDVLWEDGSESFFLTDWEDRTWSPVNSNDPYETVVSVFEEPFLVAKPEKYMWDELGLFTYQFAEGTAYSPVGVRAKPLRGVVWLPAPMIGK